MWILRALVVLVWVAACGGTPSPKEPQSIPPSEPVDSDNDGVPDDKDECPNDMGTSTAAPGCPEEKGPVVVPTNPENP